jgi:hypothetical protein
MNMTFDLALKVAQARTSADFSALRRSSFAGVRPSISRPRSRSLDCLYCAFVAYFSGPYVALDFSENITSLRLAKYVLAVGLKDHG